MHIVGGNNNNRNLGYLSSGGNCYITKTTALDSTQIRTIAILFNLSPVLTVVCKSYLVTDRPTGRQASMTDRHRSESVQRVVSRPGKKAFRAISRPPPLAPPPTNMKSKLPR